MMVEFSSSLWWNSSSNGVLRSTYFSTVSESFEIPFEWHVLYCDVRECTSDFETFDYYNWYN